MSTSPSNSTLFLFLAPRQGPSLVNISTMYPSTSCSIVSKGLEGLDLTCELGEAQSLPLNKNLFMEETEKEEEMKFKLENLG